MTDDHDLFMVLGKLVKYLPHLSLPLLHGGLCKILYAAAMTGQAQIIKAHIFRNMMHQRKNMAKMSGRAHNAMNKKHSCFRTVYHADL